ncbi:hypothetical protein [Xanthomonas cucurbitae]|uniref:hypothetical protein n=1 Tax=Xanthomonas cucurbitae TaxID=56453 RepID=UPI0030B86747
MCRCCTNCGWTTRASARSWPAWGRTGRCSRCGAGSHQYSSTQAAGPRRAGQCGQLLQEPVAAERADRGLAGHLRRHAGLPGEHAGQGKLSAAWLIEQCGWKGRREGDAGVSPDHALVLVNYGSASGAQLLDVARRIAESVRERYSVILEPEPRIIGAHW